MPHAPGPLLCLAAALTLLAFTACADPVDPVDASVDGGVETDTGIFPDTGPRDTGVEPDTGVEDDSGVADDAGDPDAGFPDSGADAGSVDAGDGGVGPCNPNPTGREYISFGTAQNPQTVTFGAGYANSRTVDLDGAYLAAFDELGCFLWLANMPASQPSFGGANLTVTPQGDIYFPIVLNGEISFYDASDALRHQIVLNPQPPAEPFTRGAAIVSYDRLGNFRWVKRIGNAATEPAAKGYSVASLELTGGLIRMAGSVNGATNGPTDDYEVVFGAGEANETRVTIGMRYQFAYVAAFDPATGALAQDSVRIDAPVVGATNYQLRHNGRGAGQSATDGSYALGQLMVGAAGSYLLNRGQADELGFAVTSNFVASFAKRDATGALAWHRLAGATAGSMSVFSSAALADGAVLFSGNGPEQADFQSAAGVVNLATGANGYLVRYDALGSIAWLRSISSRGFSNLFVDEARGALFAFGSDTGDITFGLGDADAYTATVGGAYLARLDLATGAVLWVTSVDSSTASFRDLDILGNELVASVRFDNSATFSPGTPQETAISANFNTWSGMARYDAETGQLLGVVELIRHPGTQLNDGLNMGGVYEP
ncbi:MAG: hypothetical protein H6730_21850 [Deltaproteobacteria bacterium]|nr:hypothetical protein [Deltaproteobacteria bacterium]